MFNPLSLIGALIITACLSPFLTHAATFYIDPTIGANGNDGTPARPWKTIQQVVDSGKIESREPATFPYVWGQPLKPKNTGAPVKAGDTLVLRSGYHGDLQILRYYNTSPITIAAQSGQTPVLRKLQLTAVSNWKIRGLTLTPEATTPYRPSTLMVVESHNYSGPSREITIEACTLYSIKNASAWTAGQWDTLSCNGITVDARQVTVRGNVLRNVNFGIQITNDSCMVERNTVDIFAGDGLRGIANDLVFQYNRVQGCVAVNANHDDGFQSWSVGTDGKVGTGVVKRIRLTGNTIINYTDPALPFKGTLQGIGCFDGMFEDWVIENNVIIVDHWHGISLYGAKNCRMVNNTVCDINTVAPGPPWIAINPHKNGTRSSGCIIRNNLTTSIIRDSMGVATDHNVIIKNPADFFVDYARFDLRLKPECRAIDSGSTDLAPAIDINGVSRPQNGKVDVGAYEYTTNTIRHIRGNDVHISPTIRQLGNGALGILSTKNGLMTWAMHDLHGREVCKGSARVQAGRQTILWTGRRAGGAYYVTVVVEGRRETVRVA